MAEEEEDLPLTGENTEPNLGEVADDVRLFFIDIVV